MAEPTCVQYPTLEASRHDANVAASSTSVKILDSAIEGVRVEGEFYMPTMPGGAITDCVTRGWPDYNPAARSPLDLSEAASCIYRCEPLSSQTVV